MKITTCAENFKDMHMPKKYFCFPFLSCVLVNVMVDIKLLFGNIWFIQSYISGNTHIAVSKVLRK